MKNIFFVLFFGISIFTKGQITFQKTFELHGGSVGFSVGQASDSGYIISAFTIMSELYILKTNIYGDTLWTRTFDITNGWSYSYNAKQVFDGGYIVTGDLNQSFNLIKLDSYGDTLWTKKYSTGPDYIYVDIQQTADSGFVIAGTLACGKTCHSALVLKTDLSGNILWSKQYGNGDASISSIAQTNDGGFIMTGGINDGISSVYLIKINAIGDTLWTRSLGGINNDWGMSVKQTTDSGYIIFGCTRSFTTNINVGTYLIKTDDQGNILWSKSYEQNPSNIQGGQTIDGGFIFTGLINGPIDSIALTKTDDMGYPQWTKLYSVENINASYALMQTSDDGYVIIGKTYDVSSKIYLIKTDSLGNSGCNENAINPLVNSAATLVKHTPQSVSNFPLTTSFQHIDIGSGGTVTNICSSVGVQSAITNLNSKIILSPNPFHTTSTLHISDAGIKNTELKIYNTMGVLVREVPLSFGEGRGEAKIDRGDLADGLYFYQLTNNEFSASGKFVIE